jgi:hypothetical protein
VRAFIIRPFGVKEGIDFDAVEERLIGPALDAQPEPPSGRTTGEILRSGNIRTDMFERILTADLVIADLSIHNANVFYELGIRHALRENRTILLRSRVEGHEVPFDLKTDRYVLYDHAQPEAALGTLTQVIRNTIASEEGDSPVFQLLPHLTPVDPRRLVIVPRVFSEEVAHAEATRDRGRLRLLAEEARGFAWEVAGLRWVGTAQFRLKDWEGAKDSLEAVAELFPDDVEANTRLGTVHQRLGDLPQSSLVLDRVLASKVLSPWARAEARALQARNRKTQWVDEWRGLGDVEARREAALRSGHLEATVSGYEAAFLEDRNHFYSGVNALAMRRMMTALAEAHPEAWNDRFEDEDEAQFALRRLERGTDELAAAVKFSVQSGIERLGREESDELVWARVSYADSVFCTSRRAGHVAQAYRDALAGAADFVQSVVRRQVVLYDELGLFSENTKVVLELVPAVEEKVEDTPRILLFTGHRIDAPGRSPKRFPPEKEDLARTWIREKVAGEKAAAGDAAVVGIAGGASGGDILFHEVCAELGIRTRMYLAVPARDYVVSSVSDAGPDWVRRFNELQRTTQPQVLSDAVDLPSWLRTRADYGIWQRSNLWMLHTAFAFQGHVTIIALWDGKAGDGPGGTADMVARAKERGARTVVPDAGEILKERKP